MFIHIQQSILKCKYLPHPVSSGEGLLPDESNLSPTERYMKECPELFKKFETESKCEEKGCDKLIYHIFF